MNRQATGIGRLMVLSRKIDNEGDETHDVPLKIISLMRSESKYPSPSSTLSHASGSESSEELLFLLLLPVNIVILVNKMKKRLAIPASVVKRMARLMPLSHLWCPE